MTDILKKSKLKRLNEKLDEVQLAIKNYNPTHGISEQNKAEELRGMLDKEMRIKNFIYLVENDKKGDLLWMDI